MPATTVGFKLETFSIKVEMICNDGMMLLQTAGDFYLMCVLINSHCNYMPLNDFSKHFGNFFFPNSLAAYIENPEVYLTKYTVLFSFCIMYLTAWKIASHESH